MATAKSLMKMEVVDDFIRRKAKAVNFLKSYGGGKAKLAKQLKISEDEAEQWLRKWDTTYPLVPLYKEMQKRAWREKNYIEGIYGRKKRFPPALTSDTEAYYDRIAVNFMCQNGVGDAINSALIDIDYIFDALFGWSLDTIYSIPGIILTVYDSILIECPDDLVADVTDAVKEIMGIPLPKLNISLKTDIKISQRWGEQLKEEEVEEIEYVEV
jgi:DNA polymerase-1